MTLLFAIFTLIFGAFTIAFENVVYFFLAAVCLILTVGLGRG